MSENTKPLTAQEIEELKELEAKATPGVWHLHNNGAVDMIASTGSNWPVALNPGDDDGHLVCAMRNALPSLLAMLTPAPLSPDVEAAVEEIERAESFLDGGSDGIPTILLSVDSANVLLRAVRAPRISDAVDAETVSVVMAIAACFGAWEDDVRVLGNIRADVGRDALLRILNASAHRYRAVEEGAENV